MKKVLITVFSVIVVCAAVGGIYHLYQYEKNKEKTFSEVVELKAEDIEKIVVASGAIGIHEGFEVTDKNAIESLISALDEKTWVYYKPNDDIPPLGWAYSIDMYPKNQEVVVRYSYNGGGHDGIYSFNSDLSPNNTDYGYRVRENQREEVVAILENFYNSADDIIY